jgi:hypothetical protein
MAVRAASAPPAFRPATAWRSSTSGVVDISRLVAVASAARLLGQAVEPSAFYEE